MFIIPAIDIIDGKCVRLTQGDYSQKKIYNEDPLEVAKQYEDVGLQRLHLVDLDGAKAKRIINYRVLEKIASHTGLTIDFGGGLKSNEDLKIAFESGAAQITGGTIAVKDEATFLGWLEKYGRDRIILGADVKEGFIAVSGWQEKSELALTPFIQKYTEKGIQYIICTDIAKDGLLKGSSVDLYRDLLSQFPEIKLIASGGVTTLEELEKLREMGCYGAIIGKAIYEGKLPLQDLRDF